MKIKINNLEKGSEVAHNEHSKEDDFDPVRRSVIFGLGASAVAATMIACGVSSEASSEAGSEASEVKESSPRSGEVNISDEIFLPEIVHGVEVYGLKKPINSDKKVHTLFDFFDAKFLLENGIEPSLDFIENKSEARKIHLPKEKRFIDVVVPASVYKDFLASRGETGVDFVEWEKLHVNLLNLFLENTKPKTEMNTSLNRILVLDDNYVSSIWPDSIVKNTKNTKKTPIQLDLAWAYKFKDRYPVDTDCMWAISRDNRVFNVPYFWFVSQDGNNVILESSYPSSEPSSFEYYDENRLLPGNLPKVLFDMGQLHEWSHYALNTPDESRQNVDGFGPYKFKNFVFKTGNFQIPWISPFRAMLLNRNIDENLRDPWGEDSRIRYFGERPSNISFSVKGLDGLDVRQIQAYAMRVNGSYLKGKKYYSEIPDLVVNDSTLNLSDRLFENESDLPPTNILITLEDSQGYYKELYVPAAAFIMSFLAGLDSANYEIEFFDCDDASKTTQEVYVIHDSDYDEFYESSEKNNEQFYAQMRILGTQVRLIWKLKL